jgi:16S rRNA (cytidine1402-2'-O)-methyltransferase
VGTLYLVATPIGNLDDISARALRTLQNVRLIAAEDTRHTGRLLAHFGIRTPLTSYHEHNKLTKLEAVLAALAEGDVALVSDAGTPALNDPGFELVRAVLQAGYGVSAIPGPSAPLAALVISGLPTDAFLYLGYLPRKPAERQSLLKQIAALPYTLIFLEAPQRLLASLADLQSVLGERSVAVARELTKLHEEMFRGTLAQAREHFTAQAPRGEFTLVVGGYLEKPEPWPEDKLTAALSEALAQNLPPSQAASRLSELSGWPRRQVYQRLSRLQKAGQR